MIFSDSFTALETAGQNGEIHRLQVSLDGNAGIYTLKGGTWTGKNILTDFNFSNAPFLDIKILSNSHIYLAKHKGVVSLGIALNTADVPTVSAYNSSAELYTIPEAYRPAINVDYHMLVVDNPSQAGTNLWVNTNGAIGLGTRYNALSPNVGAIYGSVIYMSA